MNVPAYVLKIVSVLRENGYSAYLVGGCVRDTYLGKQPEDYDIATSATPELVQRLFPKTVPTGIKHGTVTVIEQDGACEVTTYRVEGKYEQHRRPERVHYTQSIEEDLARRDFTINAIAFDGRKYVDPYHGLQDIKSKIIRAVGNADNRFTEDALRMVRAIRFAAQLNFTIEAKTKESISSNAHLLKKISAERIRDEIIKLLLSDHPGYGLRLMADVGILSIIVPELTGYVSLEEKSAEYMQARWEHKTKLLHYLPKDRVIRLAVFLYDPSQQEGLIIARKILRRLRFDNKTIQQVSDIVQEYGRSYVNLPTVEVKKWISRAGIEHVERLIEVHLAEAKVEKRSLEALFNLKKTVQQILLQKQPLTLGDLEINGHDLIHLGIKDGQEIGRILKELLNLVLEDESLNEKETLLRLAKEKFNN